MGADLMAGEVRLIELVKRFAEVTAVDGIDVDMPGGEFFSLLGPSGCGKTTTLRMIAGFEEPSEGTVLLDGDDVTGQPPFRRPTNTVFQSYALFPHLSVERNVAFGLERRRVSKDEVRRRVGEELERVGLAREAKRKPRQLSGGQQQRVALARALVNRPAVLLLDEPLGALDLKLRKNLQVELKRIQQDVGITFVYVTHDQEEALTMSDRIAVMNRGVIEQLDDPEEIYERPATTFVAGFIGVSNLLHLRADRVEGGLAAMELGEGERLVAAGAARPGETVVVAVRPEKIKLTPEGTGADASRVGGTVADVVYLGSLTQLIVDLRTGERLTVHRLNDEVDPDEVAVGDRVTLHWSPEASYLVENGAGRALAPEGTETGVAAGAAEEGT
jgi:spermidine/putrescine transport system ATP-binding protein